MFEEKWEELEKRIKNLLKKLEIERKEKESLERKIVELGRKIKSLEKENIGVKLSRERIKALEKDKDKAKEKIKGIIQRIRLILNSY